MKRALLIPALAVVVMAVLACVLPSPTGPPALTKVRFLAVEKGMTREQVIRFLGYPPGDYATREYFPLPLGVRYYGYESWTSDDGQLFVLFGPDGRVTYAEYFDIGLFEEHRSFDQQLRAR